MNITIQGPAGQLQAILELPKAHTHQAVAIVCHPHPLHGGTMNNKVVTTVSRFLKSLGMPVVRFNFRGVEQSEGEYGNAIGELEDLYAVMDWVSNEFPNCPIWLAGFSFGSFITAKAATKRNVAQLITIAPPVVNFDFHSVSKVPCSWVVVQGEEDEVVDPKKVFEWLETREENPTVIQLPGVGHFFHSKLVTLKDVLSKYFSE